MINKNNRGVVLGLPQKDSNNMAQMTKVTFKPDQAALHPLPITVENVANLAKDLVGQKYGWGGMYGLRDCSATTHDLLAPFGIWLARNSRPQSRQGIVVELAGLTAQEKENRIKNTGTPFLSLIGLPGHITMYVGTYNDRVAIFHNVWGVRTIEGADDNARHIIGKSLVTSLTPGSELPNLYREKTFVDRVRSINTPGY